MPQNQEEKEQDHTAGASGISRTPHEEDRRAVHSAHPDDDTEAQLEAARAGERPEAVTGGGVTGEKRGGR